MRVKAIRLETAHMIREARVSAGLSQSQLAKRIDTAQSAISRVESGSYEPSLSFLQRIAVAVGKELQLPKII